MNYFLICWGICGLICCGIWGIVGLRVLIDCLRDPFDLPRQVDGGPEPVVGSPRPEYEVFESEHLVEAAGAGLMREARGYYDQIVVAKGSERFIFRLFEVSPSTIRQVHEIAARFVADPELPLWTQYEADTLGQALSCFERIGEQP